MPFQQNDYIHRYPSSGVRLEDIALKEQQSLYTDLLCPFTDQPYPPERRTITFKVWVEYWFQPHGWGFREFKLHKCNHCGAEMLRDPKSKSWRADYCNHCQKKHKRFENRQAAKAYRQRNRHKTIVVHEPIACSHCGERFNPQRSTAKYCSTNCRVAAHRSKSK